MKYSARKRAIDSLLNTETTFKPTNKEEEKEYRKKANKVMQKAEKLSDEDLAKMESFDK